MTEIGSLGRRKMENRIGSQYSGSHYSISCALEPGGCTFCIARDYTALYLLSSFIRRKMRQSGVGGKKGRIEIKKCRVLISVGTQCHLSKSFSCPIWLLNPKSCPRKDLAEYFQSSKGVPCSLSMRGQTLTGLTKDCPLVNFEHIVLSDLLGLEQNNSALLSVLGYAVSWKASDKKGRKVKPYLDSQCNFSSLLSFQLCQQLFLFFITPSISLPSVLDSLSSALDSLWSN